MRFHRTTLLILAACLALSACKKKEEAAAPPPAPAVEVSTAPAVETTPAAVPFHVLAVDLGKGLGADKKVTDPTTTFGPKDTIYASVASEGTASGVTLRAKWTYGDAGTVVHDENLSISPTGPANTEFQISKPTPWPAGKYKVEISANGATVASKDFEIQK
jgi:hypothetical protein